ncbi:hypothetical protein [Lacipirellula sp.]|uniref:hypothetical protein n=1 Tax=Lacipirellula sp. TaxID=2691419 RepID=UPI003D135C71
MRTLRRELRRAFPLSHRGYYPYRIWLDEIRRQLGKKPRGKRLRWSDDPNQLNLFQEV